MRSIPGTDEFAPIAHFIATKPLSPLIHLVVPPAALDMFSPGTTVALQHDGIAVDEEIAQQQPAGRIPPALTDSIACQDAHCLH